MCIYRIWVLKNYLKTKGHKFKFKHQKKFKNGEQLLLRRSSYLILFVFLNYYCNFVKGDTWTWNMAFWANYRRYILHKIWVFKNYLKSKGHNFKFNTRKKIFRTTFTDYIVVIKGCFLFVNNLKRLILLRTTCSDEFFVATGHYPIFLFTSIA